MTKAIKFRPMLKQTLWGGDRIIPFKRLDAHSDHVGESWEVSGVSGHESVVAEGKYAGLSLNGLVALEKEALTGKGNYERFGDTFPLLVKFIDARQNLSIQVHPDDGTARRQGKPCGKTEMWYVMESAPGARLMTGLKKSITAGEYRRMVADGTICDAIAEYDVEEDDCFFIPAGRIHSIGAGCFLAEIQQTSDVTYRIYDFNRKDKDGNCRELHTGPAAEAIDYNVSDNYRTDYVKTKNRSVQLVDCAYFTTAVYDLDEPMRIDYSELDSFVILIGLKGKCTVTDDEGGQTTLRAGETVLFPATTQSILIEGEIKLLETYV